MKKVLIRVFTALLVIVLAVTGAAGIIWRNELTSVNSFTKVRDRNDEHLDGAVYEMSMSGSYYMKQLLAQGGVSSDGELIDFAVKHITKGLIPITIKKPQIGCSSFTAVTEEGDRLFARNYDMKKTNLCLVHTDADKDRHASISTVDLGLLGMNADKDVEGLVNKVICLAAVYAPLDGMNDAGVACGVYMTYQGDNKSVTATDQNTDKPDFTTTVFLRMVLDYADNLDEAVEIAKAYDMHDSAGTSYHYMVADASGRSAVFEWVAGTDATDTDGSKRELVITYNDDDAHIGELEGASDFQWLTNFVIRPGYYDNEEEMMGLDRYNELGRRLTELGGVVKNEEEAMELLGVVGRRSWNFNGTGITVHSAVYNLTDKTVNWVPNENYEDETAWFRYSF